MNGKRTSDEVLMRRLAGGETFLLGLGAELRGEGLAVLLLFVGVEILGENLLLHLTPFVGLRIEGCLDLWF